MIGRIENDVFGNAVEICRPRIKINNDRSIEDMRIAGYLRDGSHCGLIFSMSRHKLSHKYVATFTPQESWRSHVRDINDI